MLKGKLFTYFHYKPYKNMYPFKRHKLSNSSIFFFPSQNIEVVQLEI